MTRAAILSLSLLSLAVFGCEKKPTTPPDDATDTAGAPAGEGEGAGEGEAAPEEGGAAPEGEGGGW